MKFGSLNLLEPSGPVQACSGIDLPLIFKNGTFEICISATAPCTYTHIYIYIYIQGDKKSLCNLRFYCYHQVCRNVLLTLYMCVWVYNIFDPSQHPAVTVCAYYMCAPLQTRGYCMYVVFAPFTNQQVLYVSIVYLTLHKPAVSVCTYYVFDPSQTSGYCIRIIYLTLYNPAVLYVTPGLTFSNCTLFPNMYLCALYHSLHRIQRVVLATHTCCLLCGTNKNMIIAMYSKKFSLQRGKHWWLLTRR